MRKQYKQRNFYTEELSTGLEKLYSYNTCVGYRYLDCVFYTTRKYSRTTSKQQTQYARENNLKVYYLENDDICRLYTSLYNLIDTLNLTKALA